MARKKNPSLLVSLIGLVAVGTAAWYAYDQYEKQKQVKKKAVKKKDKHTQPPPPAYALGSDCIFVKAKPSKEDQWVAASVLQAAFEGWNIKLEVLADDAGMPEAGTLDATAALGTPPGDYEANAGLGIAVAAETFMTLVDPACLATMGVTADTDFLTFDGWVGDTENYFSMIVMSVAIMLAGAGYVVSEEGAAQASGSNSLGWLLGQ